MEGSPQKNHKNHITGKGMVSLNHYSLVHKCIPMLEEMKIPDVKAAVDKVWEKLEKYWHGS